MNLRAILVLNAIGLGSILLVLALLRGRQLHVGHAALWIGTALVGIVLASIPPALEVVTWLIPTSLPFGAAVVVALAFIFLVLIYFSVQISGLLRKVTEIAQHIGISELEGKSRGVGGQNREDQAHRSGLS